MTFFYDMNKKLKEVLDTPKSVHQKLNEGAVAEADYSAKKARAGKDIGKPGKNFEKIATSAGKKYGSKAAGERVAGAVLNKLRGKNESVEEGIVGDIGHTLGKGIKKAASAVKKVGGKALDTLGHGSDEAMRKDLQKKMGMPQTGKKPMGEEYGPLESAGAPVTPKQKKFAKLAPPADKITFADKIAGAKKEVDEMLGDVAAEAIKGALTGGQKKLDKNHNGKLDKQDFAMLRKGGKKEVADEGSDWKNLGKEYSQSKVGTIDRGAKHDIEHTATGRKVTRRTDDQGYSVGADDDTEGTPVKKGRGRPKGSGKSIGAKGPSGKSKLMKKEGSAEENPNVAKAKAILKKAGYTVSKGGEEELDEKAVSKKQQRFMGMVHATQKGEKAPSKEVAKVAKTMKKKDAEDFASTKHKGLPEKKKPEGEKKPEGKKKEKTEEQGGTGTPTASSGFSYGKGIYDSMNRELEKMIAESMSINASDSSEGGKSLTITATDEDALKLADIVRNAGLGSAGGAPEAGEVEVVGIESPISGDEGHEHDDGACDTCGSQDCACGDVHEALDENNPDWPTDEVEADNNLEYSGGLNGPKSTGQTTVPVIANQGDRTGVDDEALRRLREMAGINVQEQEQVMAVEAKEEDLDESAEEELDEAKEMCEVCEATPCKCSESVEESLAKLRGLAGIQEAAKPDFTDVDKDGDEKESWKKAEKDKEDKKVEESIFRMTNLWKAYKG